MMRKLLALGAAAVCLTAAPFASSGPGADRGKGNDVGSFRQIATLSVPEFAPYEKVEGLAVSGSLWVALDNDGGEFESRLVRYRRAIR